MSAGVPNPVERLELVIILQVTPGADGGQRAANAWRQMLLSWAQPLLGYHRRFVIERLRLLLDDLRQLFLRLWRELFDMLQRPA